MSECPKKKLKRIFLMSPWIDSMKSSQLLQNWAQLASRADTYAIWIKKRNDFIEQRLNDVEEDMIAA